MICRMTLDDKTCTCRWHISPGIILWACIGSRGLGLKSWESYVKLLMFFFRTTIALWRELQSVWTSSRNGSPMGSRFDKQTVTNTTATGDKTLAILFTQAVNLCKTTIEVYTILTTVKKMLMSPRSLEFPTWHRLKPYRRTKVTLNLYRSLCVHDLFRVTIRKVDFCQRCEP